MWSRVAWLAALLTGIALTVGVWFGVDAYRDRSSHDERCTALAHHLESLVASPESNVSPELFGPLLRFDEEIVNARVAASVDLRAASTPERRDVILSGWDRYARQVRNEALFHAGC